MSNKNKLAKSIILLGVTENIKKVASEEVRHALKHNITYESDNAIRLGEI